MRKEPRSAIAMRKPHDANSRSLATGSPRSNSKPTPSKAVAIAAVHQHRTRNSAVSTGRRLESRGSFRARVAAEADMTYSEGRIMGGGACLGQGLTKF